MAKLHLSENKFKDNIKLNETFNDSMPDWLRATYLAGKIDAGAEYRYDGVRQQKAFDKYQKKYDVKGLRGQRQYGRDLEGNAWNSDAIWRNSNKHGIDLSNATFIHGEPPKKSTDPRLKAPNQAFILIEYNGKQQVYAPGLNDKDMTIFPVADSYAPANTFKYARFSDYKDLIKDFYYVNTDDPANSSEAKTKQRAGWNSELQSLKAKGLEPLSAQDKNSYRYRRSAIDKSGYLINPDKYKDALRKAQKNNYAKKLQNAYNRIEAAKNTIVNYITEADVVDTDALRFASNVLGDQLRNATRRYNDLASQIQGLEAKFDPTSKEFTDSLDYIFSEYGEVFYLDDAINRLESDISKITFVDFDW